MGGGCRLPNPDLLPYDDTGADTNTLIEVTDIVIGHADAAR